MDIYELNKIFGAILFTVLVVMGIGVLSDVLFHAETPEKPGYLVAVEEEGGHSDGAAAAAEEEVVPLATLLASADAAKGEKVAKKCAACHTFDEGGADKVGPHLYGVVGRAKGSAEGFKYSSAMAERAAAGEAWGFDELNGFLTNPKGYLPGTTMGFAGLKKDGDRANIILYLRSLAANPLPLPQ